MRNKFEVFSLITLEAAWHLRHLNSTTKFQHYTHTKFDYVSPSLYIFIGGLMGYIYIYISQKVAIRSLWTVCPRFASYFALQKILIFSISIRFCSLYLLKIQSCIGMKFIKTVFNCMGSNQVQKKGFFSFSSGEYRGFLGSRVLLLSQPPKYRMFI